MAKDWTIPDRVFPLMRNCYDWHREAGDSVESAIQAAYRLGCRSSWQINRLPKQSKDPNVDIQRNRLHDFLADLAQ